VTIKNSFDFQPDINTEVCGSITAAVCKSVSSLFACLYRPADLHCHFHTLPLLLCLFLFYRHFLSIEKCKNLLLKGKIETQYAKGICVEKDPAVPREKQFGVYWKVNSFLEQIFCCYLTHYTERYLLRGNYIMRLRKSVYCLVSWISDFMVFTQFLKAHIFIFPVIGRSYCPSLKFTVCIL
jgi:hypothetical protein